MLDHLHTATFRAQMNSIFRIHPPCMPVVEAELVEVTERDLAGDRRPGAAARQERFAIIFRGPQEQPIQQGMYQIQHDQLGAFELFLVPVGQDKDGVYYEAVFNRLWRQDG
jgi:hypothetical protein